jgi:hypothetical protein
MGVASAGGGVAAHLPRAARRHCNPSAYLPVAARRHYDPSAYLPAAARHPIKTCWSFWSPIP